MSVSVRSIPIGLIVSLRMHVESGMIGVRLCLVCLEGVTTSFPEEEMTWFQWPLDGPEQEKGSRVQERCPKERK